VSVRPAARPEPGAGGDVCRECGGEKKVRRLEGDDLKERACPHCHGTGVEPATSAGPVGYWTK
jgi:DnaJ-class molecular chaperone